MFRTYFPDTQGGCQEVIRQICQSTKSLGVESKVFTPSEDPRPPVINHPEADIHRVKLTVEVASCGITLTGFKTFRQLVGWADIVHYHFPWPFADILHFATRVRKPALVTYHSDIVRQEKLLKVYTPLMRRFLDSVDRLVCTSPNYLGISKQLQSRADKTRIIPIGIDEDVYPALLPSAVARIRHQFGEGFFLFIGVLRYYKGLHVLLEAMAQLRGRVKVVIVGAGPLEEQLKREVEAEGLSDVSLAGYVDDVDKMAFLHLCRGIVFPSYLKSEAFGVTLLEGAMMGKPLITTDAESGTRHINIDGETGLIVPSEDPDALADAMSRLSQDVAWCEWLGQGARRRYEERFQASTMASAYVDEYRHMLGGNDAG